MWGHGLAEGQTSLALLPDLPAPRPQVVHVAEPRPFGVNLVGYEHGHSVKPIRLAALMAMFLVIITRVARVQHAAGQSLVRLRDENVDLVERLDRDLAALAGRTAEAVPLDTPIPVAGAAGERQDDEGEQQEDEAHVMSFGQAATVISALPLCSRANPAAALPRVPATATTSPT
jgi:hypothetical protein